MRRRLGSVVRDRDRDDCGGAGCQARWAGMVMVMCRERRRFDTVRESSDWLFKVTSLLHCWLLVACACQQTSLVDRSAGPRTSYSFTNYQEAGWVVVWSGLLWFAGWILLSRHRNLNKRKSVLFAL